VEDDQRRGRDDQDPDQLIAVFGAEDRVGGDPGRVVVGEAGEQAGADDGEQSGRAAGTEQGAASFRQVPLDVAAGSAVGVLSARH
jgi:hypothetical protein